MDGNQISQLLAVARVSGNVSLYRLTDLKFEKDLMVENQDTKGFNPIRVCRFNRTGNLLAVGYDSGTVEVSDYHTLNANYCCVKLEVGAYVYLVAAY